MPPLVVGPYADEETGSDGTCAVDEAGEADADYDYGCGGAYHDQATHVGEDGRLYGASGDIGTVDEFLSHSNI